MRYGENAMVSVEFYDTDNFGLLKNIWERLESGSDMSAFQSYDWYSRLNEQYKSGAFGKSDKVVYALAIKDGVPVLIAPFHIKKRGVSYKGIGIPKGIYIFGMWGFTDYLNFIYIDFCRDCFQKITELTAKKFSAETFRFYQLIKGTRLDSYLKGNHAGSLCNTTICVKISLTEDFEKYVQNLSKSVRQNIRTAKNRAAREGFELTWKLAETVDERTANELFSIYAKRSDRLNRINIKGGVKQALLGFCNRQYNRKLKRRLELYNYMTEAMQNGRQNFILILYAADKVAGFFYGINSTGSDIAVMIVSIKEDFKTFSPGILGIYGFLESKGLKGEKVTVDLTRGTEKYKYDLGGTEHELNSYAIKYSGLDAGRKNSERD